MRNQGTKDSFNFKVTIPKTVMDALALGEDDRIKYVIDGDKVYIERCDIDERQKFN